VTLLSSLFLLIFAITVGTSPLLEASTTIADRKVRPLEYLSPILLSVANTVHCQQRSCNHDNCLRALLRVGDADVGIFCNPSQIGPIPAAESDFIAKCGGSQNRMSSACACVAQGDTTSTVAPTGLSANRTISTNPTGSSTSTMISTVQTGSSASATVSTPPFAFQTGLYAPPPACPNPSPAVGEILLQFPASSSSPYNFSLSDFNTTDQNFSFSLVGDPTFNTLPELVTTLDDADETVVFNFSVQGDVYGMTATVANGSSFTIYSDGYFEFFPADCTAGWFDSIDLGDLPTNISRRENLGLQLSTAVKRASSPFNVELVVVDNCGNPINNLSPHLSCQVELTASLSVQTFFSTLQADFTPNGVGSYSGTCNTVDAANTQLLCKLGFTALCQIPSVSKYFPGICLTIGARIGQTIGAVVGFGFGFLPTLLGVFLGGRAGTWLCQAALARLSNVCTAYALVESNVCSAIANAESVAVQAVGLPGSITVAFPAVTSSTSGVTMTQTIGTVGAACSTPPPVPSSCTAVPAEYNVVNQYCKNLCERVCAVTVCPSSEAFLQQSLVGACYDNCACMTQGISLDGVCVPGPPEPGPVFCYTDPGCPPSSGQYYSQADITAYSQIFGVPPGTCPLGQTTLITGN
jgi:hypothetical protein